MSIVFKPISTISPINFNIISHLQNNSASNIFASMLSEIHSGNKKVSDSITNKVDLHELVTNVSLAETNLKILVAVRDSLMNAIHELTKMQM